MIDLDFAIKVALPSAQLAYNAMVILPVHLILPPNYSFIGLINASARSDNHVMVNRVLTSGSIFGVILLSEDKNTALITIRGTKTPQEWFDDFEAILVPFVPNPSVGLVSDGMQRVYLYIRPSIMGQIALLKVRKLIIIGHSLGAALAAYCDLDFRLAGYETLSYTFGEPRNGNALYAESFKSTPINRIVNHGDIVPQVPLPPAFFHRPTPFSVRGGSHFDDPAYAHALTTYLIGLQNAHNIS
jgi:hypothetical protein